MPSVFTAAGLALMAARRQTNVPLVVDSVQIGTLQAGQRYDATPAATGAVDPSPLTIRGDGITWDQVESRVQYTVETPSQVGAVGYSEALFWVGSVLLGLRADASGDFGSQAAGRSGLLIFAFDVANAGTAANLSISVPGQRLATPDEARSGTGDGLMTAMLTALAVAAQVPSPEEDVSNASGNWTRPDGRNFSLVLEIDAGSGGQGGARQGNPVWTVAGGAAGRGGEIRYTWYRTRDLPATVPVVVGSGGAGGAGRGIGNDIGLGHEGTAGGASAFQVASPYAVRLTIPMTRGNNGGAGRDGRTNQNNRGRFSQPAGQGPAGYPGEANYPTILGAGGRGGRGGYYTSSSNVVAGENGQDGVAPGAGGGGGGGSGDAAQTSFSASGAGGAGANGRVIVVSY